jgi:Mn-dependent DtxR family transcriptional regulator
LNVLREIALGLEENEIKSKLFLSRYSYNYTVSRLLSNGLVEYEGETLVVSRKGENVLRFEKEHPKRAIDSFSPEVTPLPDFE